MIRDPSDGSVQHRREQLETNEKSPEQPVLGTGTSGLRISPDDPAYAVRLAKSREWLKEYHARKGKS